MSLRALRPAAFVFPRRRVQATCSSYSDEAASRGTPSVAQCRVNAAQSRGARRLQEPDGERGSNVARGQSRARGASSW